MPTEPFEREIHLLKGLDSGLGVIELSELGDFGVDGWVDSITILPNDVFHHLSADHEDFWKWIKFEVSDTLVGAFNVQSMGIIFKSPPHIAKTDVATIRGPSGLTLLVSGRIIKEEISSLEA